MQSILRIRLCIRSRGGFFAARAGWFACGLRWHPGYGFVARPVWFWFARAFARIRDSLACFTRRPCAGRHLLFFAAAKKSRQKKAAHTASSSVCLRDPNRSYASHGNHVTHVRCQRSCGAPHPLQSPALPHTLPGSPPPSRWQTVCRPLVLHTHHFGPIAHASHLVRAPSYTTRQPTHSLPPGRHIPFAAASSCVGV